MAICNLSLYCVLWQAFELTGARILTFRHFHVQLIANPGHERTLCYAIRCFWRQLQKSALLYGAHHAAAQLNGFTMLDAYVLLRTSLILGVVPRIL